MGYWNNGVLEYWVGRNEICFYMDDMDPKIKSDCHPLLIPNIPFFQDFIIPWVLWWQTPPLSPSCKLCEPEAGVKSKPEPLGQDSLHIFVFQVVFPVIRNTDDIVLDQMLQRYGPEISQPNSKHRAPSIR